MSFDFDEIAGGLGPAERAELREVHELLVAATPPASYRPTAPRRVRRRRFVTPALVAAVAVAVGLTSGLVTAGGSFHADFTRAMHGPGGASAVIRVGEPDANGNRLLQMSVQGLRAPKRGALYWLYLTRHGKPVLACGTFRTGAAGGASVTMDAPGELAEYGGWIVTAGHDDRVLLST